MEQALAKQRQWSDFQQRIEELRSRGRRGLAQLSPGELSELLDSYQRILADLARARSLGAPAPTVEYLNRLAVAGNHLLYGYAAPAPQSRRRDWLGAFARAVRSAPGAVTTALLAFFVPALLSYFAILMFPELAFDLVPPEFYDFQPTSAEHLHEIPSLSRPVVASSIIANNVQVTFLAFALGISAGLGTTVVLVFNGVHIGSVAGWMTYQGRAGTLWGWILPHGSTEILAICLAGAAGYLLAGALLAPGLLRRVAALQKVATQALIIELGCIFMLLIAGLIEGNVSPSSLGMGARLAILAVSVTFWAVYFGFAGRPREALEPDIEKMSGM